MKNQQGAALVVVLSLLTASLMLGLTSMQSSMIDERLAGNYKAAAQAQMRAESAAAEAVAADLSWGASAPEFDDLDDAKEARWSTYQGDGIKLEADGGDICAGRACFYLPVEVGGEDWVMAQGAVFDADGDLIAESDPILVKVSGTFLGFFPEATLSCLGILCDFVPGSGRSGPAVDGTDREMEGSTKGANRPDPVRDSDGNHVVVPAVIMADRLSIVPGSSTGGGVSGDEIYTEAQYNEFKRLLDPSGYDVDEDGWGAIKTVIQEEVDQAVIEASNSGDIFYAGLGQTVSPGSATGVVVINGGALVMGGNEKFTGLVVMNGGVIVSTGTPAIVGAVIGKNYSFVGTGNPTILYSSEAIEHVNGRPSGESEIISWQ